MRKIRLVRFHQLGDSIDLMDLYQAGGLSSACKLPSASAGSSAWSSACSAVPPLPQLVPPLAKPGPPLTSLDLLACLLNQMGVRI